jgi:pimeloyl-ACP methyl ester carboxylesterase
MNVLMFPIVASSLTMLTLWSQREQFYFYPSKEITVTPSDVDIPYTDLSILSTEYLINAWYFAGKNELGVAPEKVILFSHGNAGNMENRLPFVQFWKDHLQHMYNLIMYDYPGFGKSVFLSDSGYSSSSSPTILNCKRSLKAMIMYLLEDLSSSHITLYGESIGGGITATVAAEGKLAFDKIVLQSTFTGMKDMITHLYPITKMISYAITEDLDVAGSLKILKDRKEKIILMHSRTDEIIPFKMYTEMKKYAWRTFEAHGGHNDTELSKDMAALLTEG